MWNLHADFLTELEGQANAFGQTEDLQDFGEGHCFKTLYMEMDSSVVQSFRILF